MRGGAGEDNTGSRGNPPTTYTHTQCTHTHNAHTRRTQHTHMHTTYIHNVHTCTQHTHNIHTRTHTQVCTQRTCMHTTYMHTQRTCTHNVYTCTHIHTPVLAAQFKTVADRSAPASSWLAPPGGASGESRMAWKMCQGSQIQGLPFHGAPAAHPSCWALGESSQGPAQVLPGLHGQLCRFPPRLLGQKPLNARSPGSSPGGRVGP